MGGSLSVLFDARSSSVITIEKRIEYLKQTPFFVYLSEEELKEYAKCFQTVELRSLDLC